MTRIALVTGGTRGIGAAISLSLKNAGYKVAASYVNNDDTAREFAKVSGVATYKWDISDFEACQQGAKMVSKDLGGSIDILVNNAGITRDSAMHKMGKDSWDAVIETNLTSVFNMSRAVLDSMRENKFGRIINISSMNGQLGQFGQTNYSAAKAGIFGFTKALARETSARGITVNTIAPGYIATDMVKAIKEDVMKIILAGIPVGRLGEPEEVARAVLFLADDQASFITGETLSINGGQFME